MLLDTNTRGLSGLEVLTWLRRQPEFNSLPVVIFTGSEDPSHKERAESLGASGYVIKPPEFDEFIKALKRIGERWLGASGAEVPQRYSSCT